jgi:hypothetical protein
MGFIYACIMDFPECVPGHPFTSTANRTINLTANHGIVYLHAN